jgi:hypothetical protein
LSAGSAATFGPAAAFADGVLSPRSTKVGLVPRHELDGDAFFVRHAYFTGADDSTPRYVRTNCVSTSRREQDA